MEITTLTRRASRVAPLLALGVLAACEPSGDPAAPFDEDGSSAVVAGQVMPSSSGSSSASTAPAATSGADPSGIRVELEGSARSAVTDAEGRFRLEIPGDAERVRLRFRRGDLDLRLEFEGPAAGRVLRIEVRLSANGDSGEGTAEWSEHEFEGAATLVALEGAAGVRSLRLSVDDLGGTVLVDVLEATTLVRSGGDLVTFQALVAAALLGSPLRVEGDGTFRADGSVVATGVEAEIDLGGGGSGDGGGSGSIEFGGAPTLVSLTGSAPARTLRVSVPRAGGTFLVDIRETGTAIEADGDLVTFASIAGALEAGVSMTIEGRGTLSADGVLAAATVKAETET